MHELFTRVMKQKTVAGEISLRGMGLHLGKMSTLTVKPAPTNSGYVFVRTDLEGMPRIKAIADNVNATY